MKDSELAAIANPGVAGIKAQMAFTGPGAETSITTKPRHYKFDPDELPPAKPQQPYIPKKYLGVAYESGSGKTPAEWSEVYGVDTVQVIPLYEGHTGGVMGLFGRSLNIGDTVELPVNLCMQLVQQGSAVFVVDSETSKDEKLIAELEAKGYHFAINRKPAREREEFQSVIKRKTSKWMSGTLTPTPANS
jgi:hypothetical protein